MDLLSLPVIVFENICSYLSYDEIARNRLVSKAFNEICQRLLNRGFMLIERRHAHALKIVKAQLPRRESERRYHPLSRHSDILTSLETRISMLNMTYGKFIDNGLCCFIPGRVIDEMQRVLTIVETSKTPPRAHEVLQELRDISSMAIEHFDDKISSEFRRKLQGCAHQSTPRPTPGLLAPLAMRQELQQLRRRAALNAKLSLFLASHYQTFHKRVLEYKKMAWTQRKTILALMRKQKQQDSAMAELKKRIEECDIKYSELTHTNQAVGGKASASNAREVAGPSQPLRHFSSQIKLDLSVLPIGTSKRTQTKALPNIKPRKSVLKLPSLTEDDDTEPAPKIPKLDAPSTSGTPEPQYQDRPRPLIPRTMRPLSTIAHIKGLAEEIRTLSNLNIESKKRLICLSALDLYTKDLKKRKLD